MGAEENLKIIIPPKKKLFWLCTREYMGMGAYQASLQLLHATLWVCTSELQKLQSVNRCWKRRFYVQSSFMEAQNDWSFIKNEVAHFKLNLFKQFLLLHFAEFTQCNISALPNMLTILDCYVIVKKKSKENLILIY